nr:hypothetical protein [Human betaherpesvirus 6]QFW97348.1 hypothetical protein [Human betaherpesvirus 6]
MSLTALIMSLFILALKSRSKFLDSNATFFTNPSNLSHAKTMNLGSHQLKKSNSFPCNIFE